MGIEKATVVVEIFDFDGALEVAEREKVAFSLEKLIHILGHEKVNQLVSLIDQVKATTGYGNISIVISDRRVEVIKQEFSYK